MGTPSRFKEAPAPANLALLVIKSCYGRFDIFTVWKEQMKNLDREATATAATKINARLTAFQFTTDIGNVSRLARRLGPAAQASALETGE